MARRIIMVFIAVIIVVLIAMKLVSNKSKINKETSYRDVVQNVAVDVRTAKTDSRTEVLSFVGVFKPSRESSISAEIPGKIASVNVSEGSLVTRGQVLAELDLAALELKLEADQAQYVHSNEDLVRYENLSKSDATTDVTLKQMRLTNKLNEIAVKNDEDQISKSKIKAPITGYLAAKGFEVGMVVSPAASIGQIANTGILKFTAMVPEYYVMKFEYGQKINVRANVFPGKVFQGTVSQVSEKSDENHQYKIEVTVSNDNERYLLRGGMNGTMLLQVQNAVKGVFVPREALAGTVQSPQVYLVRNGRAVLSKVNIGVTLGNEIQITGGIRDGEEIVTAGMNSLKDSVTIKVAGTR